MHIRVKCSFIAKLSMIPSHRKRRREKKKNTMPTNDKAKIKKKTK